MYSKEFWENFLRAVPGMTQEDLRNLRVAVNNVDWEMACQAAKDLTDLSDLDDDEKKLCQGGYKMNAIRSYINRTGAALWQSKYMVDQYCLKQIHPRFAAPSTDA